MEPLKPIPQEVHQALQTQLQLLGEFSDRGEWGQITPEHFGLLFAYMPTRVGLNRLKLIQQEMQGLGDSAQMVSQDQEALGILLGRVKELQAAAAETIHWIYPDIQPVTQTHQQVEFTRDDAALMEFVRQTGAEQLLTPDLIPSLKHLSPDQLLLLRINTLQAYLEQWEGVKDGDLDDSLGFQSPTTSLERVSLAMRATIAKRIEELTALLEQTQKSA